MVAILALDISMRTGYAYRENGVVKFGTRDFREYNSNYGLLAIHFEGWLAHTFAALDPSHLAMEKPFFSQKTARSAELLHGMVWEGMKMGYKRGVPFSKHPPASIKKSICKKGNATKDEVTQAVRNLGHRVMDDNQADAVALLLMMEAQ